MTIIEKVADSACIPPMKIYMPFHMNPFFDVQVREKKNNVYILYLFDFGKRILVVSEIFKC